MGELVVENIANKITDEQISLIDRNLLMTVEERILQLQSAVELIEELRKSLKNKNG
jgi:hypothetical protein